MRSLLALVLLAFFCGSEAYVAGRVAAPALRCSAPPAVTQLAVPRSPAVQLQAEDKALDPIAVATIGLGALGIFGSAFLTSTGSPPNGLALATITLALTAAGASAVGKEES